MESAFSAKNNPGAEERRKMLIAAIEQVARGNSAALKQVYDMTSAKLFGVILRIMHDRELAEDVLQDVYLKVWNRAGRFDANRASPISWLCVIARNAAIDGVRRQQRSDYLSGHAEADVLEEIEDDAVPADELLCNAEDNERMRRCMEALQDDHRKSIRMAFFDGLSHSELAERIGVPLGTMKSWIRRGLASLKGCLGGG
ncbi:RNA polymerase sigma factor [Croceicoccus mobilis]|uniref:RNA polymerase sigma factor n=2 Tax=Croceicoccus mobilis TaxID=1703339 RepID=A0A916YUH8_9SPHN|nr:sigma-70 family RNA polymerase sigma factor [Croceicoccus mobilis]GGD62225.1 RNA polymerase sigma factor [Croceicoccus mobilis]